METSSKITHVKKSGTARMLFKKKVVMITGGTKGNGKAIGFEFASKNYKVAFCSSTGDLLKTVMKEMKQRTGADVFAIKADVTKLQDIVRFVERTVEKFGRVDVLVNNAIGQAIRNKARYFHEISDEEIRTAMERKFLPYARSAKAVLPYMIKQGGGVIINIAGNSGLLDFGPSHMIMAYNNAAVMRLTTDLACNLAQYNILVNAVNPGPVETDRWKQLVKEWASERGVSEEEISNKYLSRIPLRRIVKPEDVANLVVFLASEKANCITGAVINIDGGMTLRF